MQSFPAPTVQQHCQNLDKFIKEVAQVCKDFEMAGYLHMQSAFNGPQYFTAWQVQYALANCRCSIFLPRSISGLVDQNDSKKRIDPVRSVIALKYKESLEFANSMIVLCLNGHTKTAFKLNANKKSVTVNTVYAKYKQTPELCVNAVENFYSWEDLLGKMVKKSVEHEMFSPQDFDNQSIMVQDFIKKTCQNENGQSNLMCHIARARMCDELEVIPTSSKIKKRM